MGVKAVKKFYGGSDNMENIYLPEGRIMASEENSFYTSTPELLKEAMDKELILEGMAVKCDADRNLYVDLGFCRGIIPKEEALYNMSGEPVKDIAVITRVGKPVCFKVTGIEKDGTRWKAVLSRRLAQKECCENMIMSLELGDVTDATVTHMEQFGAFCDIGCGIVALLPVDCISVSRISHPKDRFYTGRQIKAVIKNIDRDLCRVTLSHKELLGTWEENASLFKAGETVSGIIRSVEPYGVFVELMPNLAGLAEWSADVTPGQSAAVYIKSIIPEKNKVKLVIVDTGGYAEQAGELYYFTTSSNVSGWSYFHTEGE